jgi:putative transposase
MVLLPDHLHTIWQLPDGDDDYSRRWAFLKKEFTKEWLASGGQEQPRNDARVRAGRRGVLQRRFWEHMIRDDCDLNRHADYIHYNPVKHGLVSCPHLWPYSTFARWVQRGMYDSSWACGCNGTPLRAMEFDDLEESAME